MRDERRDLEPARLAIAAARDDVSGLRRTRGAIWPRQCVPFVVAGAALIVAGGFCAAIDGVTPSQHLAWASAYLVLVCGVAQIALGAGHALFKVARPRVRLWIYEFAVFNVANAAVLVGTVLRSAMVLDAGSVLFLVALGLFVRATWGGVTRPRSVAFAYRAAIMVLGCSVPVGVLLTR